MSDSNGLLSNVLFACSNVGITLGYLWLALFVVPRIKLTLRRTRYGAIGFFVLCGLHHLDAVAMVALTPDDPVGSAMTGLQMLVIDVPQVFCVWLFVTGLFTELVRGAAPLKRPEPPGRR